MADLVPAARAGLPDNYEPKKGLMRRAAAKEQEERCRRVKDIEGLRQAVEIKLREQHDFVHWWDGQEKASGIRMDGREPDGSFRASRTNDARAQLADFGLDRDTVSRWRKQLVVAKRPDDDSKLQVVVEKDVERCRRVVEKEKGATDQRGASGTGENEWYTPDKYLEDARRVLGAFDLDPASSDKAQEIVKATAYFTKEQDALTREWHGRVWLNPPYAQPAMTDFVTKLCEERRAGRVTSAIMVTHNYTDTKWFHKAAGTCDAICFTLGRVYFYDNNGVTAQPTQGQAFFYFGDDVEGFAEVFGKHGFIAEIWNA